MATEYLFTNNAESTLNGAIGSGDSAITIQSADASKFPSPGTDQGFYVIVISGSTSAQMLCTARSGATLTVTRTDAYSFPDGSIVRLNIPAIVLTQFMQKGVYRSNDGSPDGTLAAAYDGEEVYDSTNEIWYKHCDGTTWKPMNAGV